VDATDSKLLTEAMKYGIAFLFVAIALGVFALKGGGWWLLLWPSLSIAIVASAHLGLGPRVFGKRLDGTMSALAYILLLPYLLYAWCVWHISRIFSREPVTNEVTPGVWIGRRLLSHELPPNVDAVVDLTCEFVESRALRSVARYISCPFLDAMAPEPDMLVKTARQAAAVDGTVFIHCAQGHGRTALFASLYLIAAGKAASVDEALARIQSVRPLARVNSSQLRALRNAAILMTATK
jgi:protein-tyrosine phosphatase